MKQQLTPTGRNHSEVIEWAELIFYLSDLEYLDKGKVNDWSQIFHKVTVAGKGKRPAALPDQISWHSYSKEEACSEVWNRLLARAQKEWVLFVEDDEQVRFSDFPDEQTLAADRWSPALIYQQRNGSNRQYYQMRLVSSATGEAQIFDGHDLPDCTRYIRENDIELSNRTVLIERGSAPFGHINIDAELSIPNNAPKLHLVQGDRHFSNGKYVRAAAQYRQVLKREKLLPFDRLAGVNGLASCLAEQHKWTKALKLAEQSIDAESFQNLPYLIQFRIYELKKQWEQAHQVLRKYYERLSLYSRASFDKIMDQETTLVRLSDIALKAGDRKRSSEYFEELFTLKRGKVDSGLLQRMLVLSIELEDYQRSVHLFNRMFKGDFPDNLDEEQRETLRDIMTMFLGREWYGFTADVYQKLHEAYPNNQDYKRRLIVSLTKTNRLDQARKMVANII